MTDHRADPDFRALLAAVRHAPRDDAPRLILADWLQEHDDEPWAAFVRWQIRTRELRTIMWNQFYKAHLFTPPTELGLNEPIRVCLTSRWMPAAATRWQWTWERGFPHRVRLPAEELGSVLPLLLDEWPIREVAVSTGWNSTTVPTVRSFGLHIFACGDYGSPGPGMTDAERRRVRAAALELGRAKDRAAADRANWRRKMETV